MATGLGVESTNLIETFGNEVDTNQAAENLAKLASRAGEDGIRIQLEFMPFSGIPDLEKAWDIVRESQSSNAGLTFDTWHYYRGNPNDALLAAIPGEKIYQVQYSDAKKELQGDLVNDLLHHRLLPGEGDFPLWHIFSLLDSIGGNTSVGVELFSDVMDSQTAEEAGALVGQSLQRLIAE